jgi:hypothetical protein
MMSAGLANNDLTSATLKVVMLKVVSTVSTVLLTAIVSKVPSIPVCVRTDICSYYFSDPRNLPDINVGVN